MNRNWRSEFNSLCQTNDVPVGKPDTAMACGMSYGIRSSCAMHADSFLVERNPENADRASRAGRQHVKMAAPFPVLQHFLVVAKPWPPLYPLDLPISNGRGSPTRPDGDRVPRWCILNPSMLVFVSIHRRPVMMRARPMDSERAPLVAGVLSGSSGSSFAAGALISLPGLMSLTSSNSNGSTFGTRN